MEKKINYKGKHSNKVAVIRFVVPYNPYLLLKFNYHINVEVCSTVQCFKYLFKYCYKGHECAFIAISNIDLNLKDDNNSSNGKDNDQNDEYDYDEIKQDINTRYLCPPEAMHRLLENVFIT